MSQSPPIRRELPPLDVLARRTARALRQAATDSLGPDVAPDPWYGALVLRRCDRIAAIVGAGDARDAEEAAAQIESRSLVLRRSIDALAQRRKTAGARPPGLIALQAERQFQVFGAQCNHRHLLLNPIERIQTVLAALTELNDDLLVQIGAPARSHPSAATPAALEELAARIASARVSFALRLDRVVALREISALDELLTIARAELTQYGRVFSDGRGAALSGAAALGSHRRVLETENLLLGLAAAYADADVLRVYARAQRLRRRFGRRAAASLATQPSPAEEGE